MGHQYKIQSSRIAWCCCSLEGLTILYSTRVSSTGMHDNGPQVLVVNPAPVVDNKRDGQQTELTVCSLVEAALPPGWRIYSQCRICSVDGETFRWVGGRVSSGCTSRARIPDSLQGGSIMGNAVDCMWKGTIPCNFAQGLCVPACSPCLPACLMYALSSET
jgi:hypothetical protein